MKRRISARARQRVLALEVLGDPAALRLGERHHRAERLQQADEEEVRDLGMEDAAVELDPVVLRRDEVLVEERERDLVARAVDDDVGVDARAVLELDRVPVETADVRLDLDRPVGDAVEDAAGDRRVRLAEGVVGLRKAELHRVAGVELDEVVDRLLADLERDPRVVPRAGRSACRRCTSG